MVTEKEKDWNIPTSRRNFKKKKLPVVKVQCVLKMYQSLSPFPKVNL